ncbi:MAG: hypothetical protein MJ156_00390 [Alphaproteobacteria bacterium]|nr:hypothetical protein [Alphaproteobacteria bacterium]
MKKLITCSFEPNQMGGFITVNNGVHPDKPGHYSKTIMITREGFNEACADRSKFNEILGINIADGWQNALFDAIETCKNLKTETAVPSMAKLIVEHEIAERGEEAVAKDMEEIDKHSEEVADAIDDAVEQKGKKDGRTNRTTTKRKSSTNTRRKSTTKLSDGDVATSSK